MSGQPRDHRYQVSADRESPVRRVRYVETNRGDSGECSLCQMDDGSIATAIKAEQSVSEQDDSPQQNEDELVQEQLVTAIENQLQANEPSFVQAVLNKLLLVGTRREEAVEMMAYVLAVEIQQSFTENRGFAADNYERLLRALPTLPEMSGVDD